MATRYPGNPAAASYQLSSRSHSQEVSHHAGFHRPNGLQRFSTHLANQVLCLPLVVLLSRCLLAPSAVEAQDYVTTQWVFLRRQAANTGAKIQKLSPGESLAARTVPERSGFVPVRTADGVAGWVGERFVRALRAEALSASTFLAVNASGAATRIDPTWEKPPVVTSTIKIRTDSGQLTCGPRGRSKRPDDGTNYQKNQTDVPTTSHLVTVDAIRALNDTVLWRLRGLPPHRTRWTGDDSALVTPYEGIPVTVRATSKL